VFRKLLFNIHWLLGISFGIALAVIGITGAALVFEDEIISALNGNPDIVEADGERMGIKALLDKIREGTPDKNVAGLMLPAAADKAATVFWVREKGGRIVPPKQYSALVNPYTGELIDNTGDRGTSFMASVELLHRRLTLSGGPGGGPPSEPTENTPEVSPAVVPPPRPGPGEPGHVREVGWREYLSSYTVLSLMILLLSGLYLYWPHGRAWYSWRAWLSIDFRIKGYPFIWRLHAVIGTIALAGYFMSAHSGLVMSEIYWYKDSFNTLAGADYEHGQIHGAYLRDWNSNLNAAEYDYANLWDTFEREVPEYSIAIIELSQSTPNALCISYFTTDTVGGEAGGRDINTIVLDAGTGDVISRELFNDKPLLEQIVRQNFDVHSGNFFGMPGRFYILFTSLSMPFMLITGWMMYLARRKRKRERKSNTADAA
jgi:sulfite reductase (NADPH) flavoprotein alpha-component